MKGIGCAMGLLALVVAACGPHPESPLARAAFEGDAARVRSLLEGGVDPNGPESPLILAARAGHAPVVEMLVRAGADPNQRGGVNDWTALMHAVHRNQEGTAAALIEGGADPNGVNGHRETALMMAAGYGHTSMVRLLLSHGADPRLHDVHGATALDKAISGVFDIDRITVGKCQPDTVRVLLDAAPDLARTIYGRPRCPEVLQLVEAKRR